MAQRSLRPCKQRWCKNLTRDVTGYCGEHIHIAEERQQERNRYYDKHIRYSKDEKYTKFYHRKEWESLREDVLRTYNGVDIYSYYIDNRAVTANTAHHIIELKEDWDKRLDKDNIFPLTDANHKKYTHYIGRIKKELKNYLESY